MSRSTQANSDLLLIASSLKKSCNFSAFNASKEQDKENIAVNARLGIIFSFQNLHAVNGTPGKAAVSCDISHWVFGYVSALAGSGAETY